MERWAPFKELWNGIQNIVLGRNQASFHHVKALLRKHRPDLFSLLKNPPKNTNHRRKVQNAVNEGIILEGETTPQIFSQDFIDESLILSDLFDLNEFSALELLSEGEQQLPHYPNLTRGLIAVVLYWDGRKCLVSSLRTLIQCRRGQTWAHDVSDEVIDLATTLTDELLEDGMTIQILKLISTIQVEKEMEKLSNQRGLGDKRHRKLVRDLITNIRNDLGECLFYFAGQSNLPVKDAMLVIEHLENKAELTADGKLSSVSLSLLNAVLYCFSLPQDVPIEQDDRGLEILLKHPAIAERDFVSKIHKKLIKRDEWKIPGLKACLQLAWSLTLRSLALIPNAVTDSAVETFSSPGFTEALEQDEMILEMALAGKTFQFLKENVVTCSEFPSEEFYVRRIHGIVTDLIVNMPLKVKEMRNHGDEVARIMMLHMMEGEEPPVLREDFKQFMELITTLYGEDPNHLGLSLEFWCPASDTIQIHHDSSYLGHLRVSQRLPQKQVSLFKFLRQSGDLLPPLLFIPYLKMLAALSTGSQSARMAFEMIRMNGNNSGVAGEGSNVSWNHFFSSINRYCSTLHRERSVFDPHAPTAAGIGTAVSQPQASHHHLHQWLISPQEIEGLRAVLQLIAKITKYDDISCHTIYENPHWNACPGLLGLLQCPIPAVLKGDVLLALNELARIPEISIGLLHSMEGVQILTQPDSSGTRRGIEVELEDVESRDEQYHMTRAFLNLLCTLTSASSSVSFASSQSSSGFEPYLKFAIETVFLKFISRSYKRQEEKWEVAACALRMFNKLLVQYVPHHEDFASFKAAAGSGIAGSQNLTISMNLSMNSTLGGFNTSTRGQQQAVDIPPGFRVLVHLMNEGDFFKTVMCIIEECISNMENYSLKPELEKSLTEAGLLSLQLIQIALDMQDSFLSCMRESGCPILVSTLDKLLLGINPRTGKADYVVITTKFVIHNATHPQLSLVATAIISSLCRMSVSTQREVFAMITTSCDTRTRSKILHGFVEAIESGQPEVNEDSGEEYPDASAMHNSACRTTILRLLLYCIDLPVPNLSHFLLGFNLTKIVSKTSLQDAGVLGSSRTCLHSVLSILSAGMETTKQSTGGQPIAITDTPVLAELCFQLIYKLSANMETTGPVLRYLRSSHDFVFRHLQHIPYIADGNTKGNFMHLQQAWLLKTLAIELYSTATNRQRSHTQRLVQLLFDKQATLGSSILGASQAEITSSVAMPASSFMTSALGDSMIAEGSVTAGMSVLETTSLTGVQERSRILKILDIIDFSQEFPSALVLEQFVPANVEQAIQSCETKDEQGLKYCDIKALHELLEANVNTLQGADGAGRRSHATQEVQNILKTAVERNQTRQSIHSKLALLNAWKQTLGVALNACPTDLMPKETRQQILLNLLQELLSRVLSNDSIPELTSPIGSICLTLITHLRSCFANASLSDLRRPSTLSSDHISSQDLNLTKVVQRQDTIVTIQPSMAASLQVIMRGIIEWLLQAGVGQKVRADLYASLLYYLQLCQKPRSKRNEKDQSRDLTGLRISTQDIYSKLSRDNLKLFQTYGEALMMLICKDSSDGHNVCRILAYSCLDAIVQIDWKQTWLQFMSKKGYINNISHSFTHEDESLQESLSPHPEPLRSLYIYEQKMAFLSSLARTPGGARAVLDSGILKKLAECSFLDMRPATDDSGFDSFVPSVMSRYRQLLFPALKLCSSILASLGGTSHYEATALVLEFMLAHSDSIINVVLKTQQIPDSVKSLEEIKYVTGILSQVASQDFSNETMYSSIPQGVLIELQGHLSKIQRQLLALLPHYVVNEDWIREIQQLNQENETREDAQEIILLVHEICANIISYCCSITHSKSHDSDTTVLLFSPNLDESSQTGMYSQIGNFSGTVRRTGLGLIVQLLRSSTFKFNSVQESVVQQKRRLDNMANLTTQELKELTTSADEKLSIPQRQMIAAVKLQNEVTIKEQLSSKIYFIMENCLLLLWQHLDSYILKSGTMDTRNAGILFPSKSQSRTGKPVAATMQDMPLGVSREEINELKRLLPSAISDVFLTKLCDIEEHWQASSRCTFVRPLVRQLQRIVRLHTGM